MEKSPFKFLDAYQKEDVAVFFGREQETAQLYNAVFASHLTLLYGASGTGKTSLVNCGLANKFYDTDWLPLYIRRGNNINDSLRTAIQGALRSAPADSSLRQQVQQLYWEYYKSIYLIFDQFEELFILGSQTEQLQFYQTMQELLERNASEEWGSRVKVLLCIREEWIAYLNEFEKMVPTLFDNRIRVEKMNDKNLYRVISGTCRYYDIIVEQPSRTIIEILENLRDRREGVELTNLQVYLDRLFRKSAEFDSNASTAVFTPALVQQVGSIKNVLSVFLDEQLLQLEQELIKRGVKNPKGIPLEILFAFVTEDKTKRGIDIDIIMETLPKNRQLSRADVEYILNALQKIRILRQLE